MDLKFSILESFKPLTDFVLSEYYTISTQSILCNMYDILTDKSFMMENGYLQTTTGEYIIWENTNNIFTFNGGVWIEQ